MGAASRRRERGSVTVRPRCGRSAAAERPPWQDVAMRLSRVLAVVVWSALACRAAPVEGPGDDTLAETDPIDSVPSGETDPHSDQGPTDAPTDTAPVDTGEPLPPTCSASLPDGPCPPGSTCVDARCVLVLDPGDPVGELGALWDRYVEFAEARELAPEALPVSWSALREEVAAEVASAGTAFEAAWAMTRGVARLRNGHTYLDLAPLCDVDPGLSQRQSDAGACVVEAEGRLVVNQVEAGTPWRLGDVLLALDGRPAAELVADRLAQPRCRLHPPTDSTRRAEAVASLLLRGDAAGEVRVRGADGLVRTFARPFRMRRLDCVGRVAPPTEADAGSGVWRADLPGGVVLLRLPVLGGGGGGGSGSAPMIARLREIVSGLGPGTPVIVDLRGVQGGFSEVADALAGWALPDGSPLRTCTDRLGPGSTVGPSTRPSVAEEGVVLDGPLAVLVDGTTFGAPEYLSLGLEGRALRLGAPSYGSHGLSGRFPEVGVFGAVDVRRCDDAQGRTLEGRPALDRAVELRAGDVAAGIDTMVEAARVALLSP